MPDKGLDAIEPDNVDGYAYSGLPLTTAHQLQFNRMVARLAPSAAWRSV